LPQLLAASREGRLLVQPSTDGVFSGAEGASAVSKKPDAVDEYGLSKRLGEACGALGPTVLLRTSLVGPELGAPRSLFGWLRAQSGTVRGFTDQLWNGVTTLVWAKACLRALRGDTPPGLVQLGTPQAVTKYELLALIADVFELDVRVEGQASGRPVDRRLVPTEAAAPLREQLVELRRWY
jgi:dTDP-4-dehydrorhamnose reductase